MNKNAERAPDEPLIYLILVNYNSYEELCNFLLSAAKQDFSNFKIVVIDNASNEDEQAKIKSLSIKNKFKLIQNLENTGFAAAINLGLKSSLAEGFPDYFFVLNPDITLAENSLSSLLFAANKNPEISLWGSMVLEKQNEKSLIWSLGGEVDFLKQAVDMKDYGKELSSISNQTMSQDYILADYIPGCAMFFSSALLDEAGFLPEDYFLYFEETSWCLNLRKKNKKVAICPKSRVWHHFKNNKRQEIFHVYYYNRSSYIFWFRHAPLTLKIKLILKLVLKTLPNTINALMHAERIEDKNIFKAHIWAILDFLLRRPPRKF